MLSKRTAGHWRYSNDDTNPSTSTHIPPDSSSGSQDNSPPVPHISTNASGIKHALLSHYIALAESHIPSLPTRTTPVFSHIPETTPPTLYSDRENRTLFYPGCFNPPHAGHAALLWPTYLLTDANTIAVLIFALPDESLSSKQNTSIKTGKEFQLSHFQRQQLWKDDILCRFTWVFPSGDADDEDGSKFYRGFPYRFEGRFIMVENSICNLLQLPLWVLSHAQPRR